jgi:ATP phosphoribosyltransferase
MSYYVCKGDGIMDYITFALAKGRLADKTMALLEQLGITCDEMKEDSRKLIFTNEEKKFKFFLAKATDVPTYVESGAADIGIVGKDTLLQENRNLYEVLDLGFGKCQFAVAGYAEARALLNRNNDLRVATKYPNIAKEYFYHKKHQTIEIVKLNGSVELAPIVGLSDVIVDIVETGSTLKANGLEVLEYICPVSARMVVNRVSMKLEHERIAQLISGLRSLEELK